MSKRVSRPSGLRELGASLRSPSAWLEGLGFSLPHLQPAASAEKPSADAPAAAAAAAAAAVSDVAPAALQGAGGRLAADIDRRSSRGSAEVITKCN